MAIKTVGQALEIVKNLRKLIPGGGSTLILTYEEFNLIKEANGLPRNNNKDVKDIRTDNI